MKTSIRFLMLSGFFFSCVVSSKYAALDGGPSRAPVQAVVKMPERLIRADNPFIRIEGRADRPDSQSVRFDWPGVRIHARFNGTSCAVWLEDGGNDYNVYLDGKKISVLVTTPHEKLYHLAGGLEEREHELQLSKRTEGSFGRALFRGILLDEGGTLLESVPLSTRRIQFIGDSITCGYGNEGSGRNCSELRPYQNNDLTYAAMTARALSADYHILAVSGRGMVRNYGDKNTVSTEPLPAFYDRTLQSDPGSRWNHKTWVPDVVVIALGANDFSTDPAPDEKTWSGGYESFVRKIRKLYPDTLIFCVATRIQHAVVREYLERMVGRMNDSGDRKVRFAEFPVAEGHDSGCDWHPLVTAHEVFAESLTRDIRDATGWNQ